MSPVAAECVSAASAAGPAAVDPAEDADEDEDEDEDVDAGRLTELELLVEEPQPATATAAAAASRPTGKLFWIDCMYSRVTGRSDYLLNGGSDERATARYFPHRDSPCDDRRGRRAAA
jgi:hypothetical protein